MIELDFVRRLGFMRRFKTDGLRGESMAVQRDRAWCSFGAVFDEGEK